jgi:hypothetical protein
MDDSKIIPFTKSFNPVTNRTRIEMPPTDPALEERIKTFLNKALAQPREVEWFALVHLMEETLIEMIRMKGVKEAELAVGRQLDIAWAQLEASERTND